MKLAAVLFCMLTGVAFSIPVSSVSVEGNTYVSDSLIIRTLGISAGSVFLPSTLPQGVRDLFSLGYFTDIEILADSTGGNADFTIRVSENPILSALEIENPGCLKEGDLVDTLAIFPGQTISINDIDQAVDLITSMYADDNRHLATVTHHWNEPDPDGRRVRVFV